MFKLMNKQGILDVVSFDQAVDAVLKIGFVKAIVLLLAFTACTAVLITVWKLPEILKIIFTYKTENKRLELSTQRQKERALALAEKAKSKKQGS